MQDLRASSICFVRLWRERIDHCYCGLVQEVLGGFEQCRMCNCGADSHGDGSQEPKKPVRGFRQCEETLCGFVSLELNSDSLEFILLSEEDQVTDSRLSMTEGRD